MSDKATLSVDFDLSSFSVDLLTFFSSSSHLTLVQVLSTLLYFLAKVCRAFSSRCKALMDDLNPSSAVFKSTVDKDMDDMGSCRSFRCFFKVPMSYSFSLIQVRSLSISAGASLISERNRWHSTLARNTTSAMPTTAKALAAIERGSGMATGWASFQCLGILDSQYRSAEML